LPLAVICRGRSIEVDKPHNFIYAAETGFLRPKEQVPFNSGTMLNERLSLDATFDPCQFSLDSTF
jgi:hypothetical protein